MSELSKMKHKFQSEVFIPWCAISRNINFMLTKNGVLESIDGVKCQVKKIEEIHVLSPEAAGIIRRLYMLNPWQFLELWYKNCPDMCSMTFLWMNIEKYKDVEP